MEFSRLHPAAIAGAGNTRGRHPWPNAIEPADHRSSDRRESPPNLCPSLRHRLLLCLHVPGTTDPIVGPDL